MAEIKWTLQAIGDLEAISEFISRDSAYYARLFINKIISSTERLKKFPQSGRILPEINQKHIREILLGNYRIIYRVNNELVEILTVYHSARILNIENIKKEM
jgi:addiction module RelE/StbE family toxin